MPSQPLYPVRNVFGRVPGQVQVAPEHEATGAKNRITSDPSEILNVPELWACTTCSTCTLRCPAGVKNVEMIMGLRNILARQGDIPSTLRDALENTLLQGNPWGRFRDRRADWAKDLGVKVAGEAKAETLLYVGCTPSYDPRIQILSTSLVKILQKAEVDFVILGKKESCCGNEIRRMGEQTLFKKLVKDNSAQFQKSGCRKMIVISPHCFNAFRNEYPDLGIRIEHYTQTIAGLIETGKLKCSKETGFRATYRTPAFWGNRTRSSTNQERFCHHFRGWILSRWIDPEKGVSAAKAVEEGCGLKAAPRASETGRYG